MTKSHRAVFYQRLSTPTFAAALVTAQNPRSAKKLRIFQRFFTPRLERLEKSVFYLSEAIYAVFKIPWQQSTKKQTVKTMTGGDFLVERNGSNSSQDR